MISKELSEAAVELDVILKNISPELVNKIPKSFINYIKEIASKTYTFNYDKTKSLEKQNIKPKTKGLIAIIYENYLCDENEKIEYQKYVSKILKGVEEDKKEKYNPDNVFINNDLKIKENILKEKTDLVSYKKSIFRKFINIIKKFFKRHDI